VPAYFEYAGSESAARAAARSARLRVDRARSRVHDG